MKTYVINRNCDMERWLSINSYVKDPVRIPAVPLTDNELISISDKHGNMDRIIRMKEISNRLSFRNAFLTARSNRDKIIAILEDDAVFSERYEDVLKDISRLPSNFGVCYLGYYIKKNSTGKIYRFDERFMELKGEFCIWGAHAIVYNKNVFDIMIDGLSNSNILATDILISSMLNKFRSFIRYPMVARQGSRFSGSKVSMHGIDFTEHEKNSEQYIKDNTQ